MRENSINFDSDAIEIPYTDEVETVDGYKKISEITTMDKLVVTDNEIPSIARIVNIEKIGKMFRLKLACNN